MAIRSGSVTFAGADLARLGERAMEDMRGNRIAMIFQEPMTSLNPVLTVGEQVAEVVRRHEGAGAAAARSRALDLFRLVRIPDAAARLDAYPHQLSGGQRQRVMIAAALACRPDVLLADEPTTALDVTIQAEILALLRELQAEMGLALALITHDLGVVRMVADRVLVMYAGRKVEEGSARDVLRQPRHPYTSQLLAARPHHGRSRGEGRLAEIGGMVPAPGCLPPGCAFQPRCERALPECTASVPPFIDGAGHGVACVLGHD